ncbi:MAG: ATP-dependent RNA helicase RhlB [Deltaproteobacteria bacterium]|nr:ATP-dependent RNA helicase RhlB [Deltaproteobacteria bacterium]
MINFIQKVVKKISSIGKAKSNPITQNAKMTQPGPAPQSPGADSPPRPRRTRRRKSRKTGAAYTVPTAGSEPSWNIAQYKVPPEEGKMRFHDFDLPDPLMHAVYDLGFQYCTPIQSEILPSALSGKDASGRAQTGTGKTAAFLITIIERFLKNPIRGSRKPGTPRALVIAPTRELVVQISEEANQLAKYTDLKVISLFGGMDYEKQMKQLAGIPVDIVVATPGRLLDFQRRGDLILNKTEIMVIDEADRMLDMGFIPDVRMIIHSTPPKEKRQTMLFSATLTKEVVRLAAQWTNNPVTVDIEPEQVAVDTVDQIVYIVTSDKKFALLYNIIDKKNLERVLVFCNRKDEVSRLADILTRYGIKCSEMSGDIPQQKRISRLNQFKAGNIRVLVATDVAGRGLHIEGMDHVINFTLPYDPEDYVHRIGRTGRAGAAGTSISFADERDAFYLPPIEEFMGRKLDCIYPEEDWLILPEAPPVKRVKPEGDRKKDGVHRGRGQTRSAGSGARQNRSRPRPPGKSLDNFK